MYRKWIFFCEYNTVIDHGDFTISHLKPANKNVKGKAERKTELNHHWLLLEKTNFMEVFQRSQVNIDSN